MPKNHDLMEVRKLQTTSAGTFILTIPKEWTGKLGLKKGDLVTVELEENEIVVAPNRPKATSQSKSLDIEQFKDQKLLELCITASYIQGNDITEIVSKHNIDHDQKRWIRQAVEGLIGVEISEDYADRVVLQNLVEPSKFDVDSLLQRFADTTKAIFLDAIRALIEHDITLAQDAFERGEGSTKLYRLLMRQAFQAARSKKVRDDMGFRNLSTVIIRTIAIRELGRMAYYSMRIAQHVVEVERNLDEQMKSIVQKMARISAEMQEQSLSALLHKDLALASSIINRMVQVRKLYESSHPLADKYGDRSGLALNLIIRDIRAFAGYAVALADDAVLGVFDI